MDHRRHAQFGLKPPDIPADGLHNPVVQLHHQVQVPEIPEHLPDGHRTQLGAVPAHIGFVPGRSGPDAGLHLLIDQEELGEALFVLLIGRGVFLVPGLGRFALRLAGGCQLGVVFQENLPDHPRQHHHGPHHHRRKSQGKGDGDIAGHVGRNQILNILRHDLVKQLVDALVCPAAVAAGDLGHGLEQGLIFFDQAGLGVLRHLVGLEGLDDVQVIGAVQPGLRGQGRLLGIGQNDTVIGIDEGFKVVLIVPQDVLVPVVGGVLGHLGARRLAVQTGGLVAVVEGLDLGFVALGDLVVGLLADQQAADGGGVVFDHQFRVPGQVSGPDVPFQLGVEVVLCVLVQFGQLGKAVAGAAGAVIGIGRRIVVQGGDDVVKVFLDDAGQVQIVHIGAGYVLHEIGDDVLVVVILDEKVIVGVDQAVADQFPIVLPQQGGIGIGQPVFRGFQGVILP